MKKIIITVYSFDELNDEAKQKAIETEHHNELIYSYCEKVVKQLEKGLNDKIEELNKSLYSALKEEYEYSNSDEVIAKEFKDNESSFYEDGTLYQY